MSKSPMRGLPTKTSTSKPKSPGIGRAPSPSHTLRVHAPSSPPRSPTTGHRQFVESPSSRKESPIGKGDRNSHEKSHQASLERVPSTMSQAAQMGDFPKFEHFTDVVEIVSPTRTSLKASNQKAAKPQLTVKNLAKFAIEKEDAPLHTAIKDLDYPCNDKSLGVNSFAEWSYFKNNRNYSKREVADIDAKLEEEYQASHVVHHTLRSNTANEKVRHHKHPIEIDRLLINSKSCNLWSDDLLNRIENQHKYKQEPEYKVIPKVKETKIHKLRMKNAKVALQKWFNAPAPASMASSVAGSNVSSVKTESKAKSRNFSPNRSGKASPSRSTVHTAGEADDSTIATDISGSVVFDHSNMSTSVLTGEISGIHTPADSGGAGAGAGAAPKGISRLPSTVDVLSPMMSRMPSGHIQGLSKMASEVEITGADSGAASPMPVGASLSKQPSGRKKKNRVKVTEPAPEEIKAALTVKRTSRDTSTALKGGTDETTMNDVLEHIHSKPPSRAPTRAPTRAPSRAPTRAPSPRGRQSVVDAADA